MGLHLGIEVRVDDLGLAGRAESGATVREGYVLGIALLGIGLGLALAVDDGLARPVEERALDSDGPVAELISLCRARQVCCPA
jgi:hypothetical protein